MADTTGNRDSGSPERVAMDLVALCIQREGVGSFNTRKDVLDLFRECLEASQGKRMG